MVQQDCVLSRWVFGWAFSDQDPTTTTVDASWNDNHGGLFNGMTSCTSDLDWAETFLPGGLLTCEDWIDPSQIVVEWDDFPEGSSLVWHNVYINGCDGRLSAGMSDASPGSYSGAFVFGDCEEIRVPFAFTIQAIDMDAAEMLDVNWETGPLSGAATWIWALEASSRTTTSIAPISIGRVVSDLVKCSRWKRHPIQQHQPRRLWQIQRELLQRDAWRLSGHLVVGACGDFKGMISFPFWTIPT